MTSEGTRLNKFLASCGVGSRRACDALIQKGGVTINGEECTNPATRVAEDDEVRVDRKRVAPKLTATILFQKPKGYVCSKSDELGRATIYELLPPKFSHLNHVGRLDRDSEGLLVLTNDGDLANRLTHPSNKVEKEYQVTLATAFDSGILEKLTSGVRTPEGRARAKSVRRLSPRRVAMVLDTGLKRQIREMFNSLSIRVTKLLRIRIGQFMDPELPLGRWRPLENEELALLTKDPPAKGKRS
jgi:23S rRNA pseudouridine2605 synthase